jgi:hypothetical protein
MLQTRWREPSPSADATSAQLVLDAADQHDVPRLILPDSAHQATLASASSGGRGPISGSGSGQFSAGGWETLQREIAGASPTHVAVVDLRKESHGFLNRNAVSWYATQNWGCAGLQQVEALELERIRLDLLSRTPSVFVGTKANVVQGAHEGGEYLVESVLTERELVERSGVEYARIAVNDHCRPDDNAVNELVQFFSRLPARAHVHFHCRGGKGRTATALALLDIFLHAGLQPLEEILARQAAHTGYLLDDAASAEKPEKAVLRQDRLQMLREFYAAARV